MQVPACYTSLTPDFLLVPRAIFMIGEGNGSCLTYSQNRGIIKQVSLFLSLKSYSCERKSDTERKSQRGIFPSIGSFLKWLGQNEAKNQEFHLGLLHG